MCGSTLTLSHRSTYLLARRTCPWYHLKWPANRQDKWTKCTGIGKYVKYHEDVNLGLFITDRVINPIGGYTECLLTALNAAVSRPWMMNTRSSWDGDSILINTP